MSDRNRNPEFIMKMAFVAIGVIVVLAFILGSFFWNLMFDPENFDVNKWANRAVFNGSISLAMMVLGFIAIDSAMTSKEEGVYLKLVYTFNDLVEKLYEDNTIIYFDQFIPWLADIQLREKKIRHLTKRGMGRMEAEAIVDFAKVEDIEVISGVKPGEKSEDGQAYGQDVVRTLKDGKEILIPAIKASWAPYVEDVLTDRITLNVEDASYYLTAGKNKDANLTTLERAQATERERVKAIRFSFVSKILIGLVYTAVFSLLVVDLNSEMGTSEALWNLMLRLGSATIGFLSGGFAGNTNVRFVCKWVKEKMKVIRDYNKYLETKQFAPKSYTETMKERIEAAKKERENVTFPVTKETAPKPAK